MPRVLYCHGLESGPLGYKVRELRKQGFDVTAPAMSMSIYNPLEKNSLIRSLINPLSLVTRWPTQWLPGAMDDSFAACVDVMRQTIKADNDFDVLCGSSWGGAVSCAVIAESTWTGPTVLLCPALATKERWVGGSIEYSVESITAKLAALPAERKARLLLVHGTADTTVPLDDSQRLAEATGIQLELVEGGSHGLGSIVKDGRLAEWLRRVTQR